MGASGEVSSPVANRPYTDEVEQSTNALPRRLRRGRADVGLPECYSSCRGRTAANSSVDRPWRLHDRRCRHPSITVPALLYADPVHETKRRRSHTNQIGWRSLSSRVVGNKGVDADNAMAGSHQLLTQMGSDKTGRAGDRSLRAMRVIFSLSNLAIRTSDGQGIECHCNMATEVAGLWAWVGN